MSYSFSVVGASKAEARERVEAKFAEIVAQQPVHAADHQAALAVANAFIDVLADPTEEHTVSFTAYGSLSYGTASGIYGANVSVTAGLLLKPVEA